MGRQVNKEVSNGWLNSERTEQFCSSLPDGVPKRNAYDIMGNTASQQPLRREKATLPTGFGRYSNSVLYRVRLVPGEAVTLPSKISNADETRPPRSDEGKVRSPTLTAKGCKIYYPLVISLCIGSLVREVSL